MVFILLALVLVAVVFFFGGAMLAMVLPILARLRREVAGIQHRIQRRNR